jgi:hypothetical protein
MTQDLFPTNPELSIIVYLNCQVQLPVSTQFLQNLLLYSRSRSKWSGRLLSTD